MTSNPDQPTDVHPEILQRHLPTLFVALLQQQGRKTRDDLVEELKSRTGWALERIPTEDISEALREMMRDGVIEPVRLTVDGRPRAFYVLTSKAGKELHQFANEAKVRQRLEADLDLVDDPREWEFFRPGADAVIEPTIAAVKRAQR